MFKKRKLASLYADGSAAKNPQLFSVDHTARPIHCFFLPDWVTHLECRQLRAGTREARRAETTAVVQEDAFKNGFLENRDGFHSIVRFSNRHIIWQ